VKKIPSEIIERFMEAIYPGAGALALASFDEMKALSDATEEINCLRKDAERYRWLREQHWSDGKVTVTTPGSVKLGHDTFSRERLDLVIDEARS
jgi:hypothetical protein